MKTSGLAAVAFLASIAMIFSFFLITTLMMSMTGEDILHQNGTLDKGLHGTVSSVYNFLPRIGEFLQRLAIQFYDYQTHAINGNFAWRVFDAVLCLALIYLVAMLSVGRRLKLELKDAVMLLSAFVLFIGSRHNEIFMMRFSYLHNYIPMLIALASVGYMMLYSKADKVSVPRTIVGLLAGVMLGASNEIAPIAFLLMVMGYVLYRRFVRGVGLKGILSGQSLKVAVVLGVVLGLLFMFSSGAITSRGGSAYGVVYGYVSLFDIFNDTFYTLAKLLRHFIFNGRYLWLPLIALSMFVFVELYLSRRRVGSARDNLKIHLATLSFTVLYMLATSQINVLDDLYPRFMSPVYVAVVVSFLVFGSRLVDLLKPGERVLWLAVAVLMLVSAIAVIDVSYGFRESRKHYWHILERVKNSKTDTICVNKTKAEQQLYSPLFKFTSFSPFEEWTGSFGNSKIYGKQLLYTPSCVETR